MSARILTADRPTGKLHLGHYVGSLTNRLGFQDQYQQYVMIADVQALTDYWEDPDLIIKSIYEVGLDYLSVGLDPLKTTFFVQSQIPQLFELTTYFSNLVSKSRLERNPTIKAELEQKSFGSVPMGFFSYPISQAADIALFKATLVPVGEDQQPLLELTNEIVRKFNHLYQTGCLLECQAVLNQRCSRLIGICGQHKASKSLGNAIFLSDPLPIVKEKVFQMYTDPNHIRISDPGKVEGNVVFAYLDAFHPSSQEVVQLKQEYEKGGLGDVYLKNILYKDLTDLLEPIQERRQQFTVKDVKEILYQGCHVARTVANASIQEVRQAMKIMSFE